MTGKTLMERLEAAERELKNERTAREQLAERIAQIERQIGVGPAAQRPVEDRNYYAEELVEERRKAERKKEERDNAPRL